MALESELGVYHIVLGPLEEQARYLQELVEQQHGTCALEEAHKIHDKELVGAEPTVWFLGETGKFDLGADAPVQFWRADPFEKRGAGINAVVRVAGTLLNQTRLSRDVIDYVGDKILDEHDQNMIDVLLWDAVWALTDKELEQKAQSKSKRHHPWEKPWEWCKSEQDLNRRLNTLYRDMVGYVYALENDWTSAKRFGLSPSRFAWLKTLRINPTKVDAALVELSKFRGVGAGQDPYAVALKIGSIFS